MERGGFYVTKEINSLNEVYQTIANITSIEDALKIYQQFKGLTITFPTKLINADYVKQYLRKEMQKNGRLSSREVQYLARKFDYSERQIRRFMNEVKQVDLSNHLEEEELIYITKWLEKQQSND